LATGHSISDDDGVDCGRRDSSRGTGRFCTVTVTYCSAHSAAAASEVRAAAVHRTHARTQHLRRAASQSLKPAVLPAIAATTPWRFGCRPP